MNTVFLSNYLNVHQLPFCQEMNSILGEGGFTFVAETPFNQARLSSGYEDLNRESFVVRSYESEEQRILSEKISLEADVAIMIPGSPFVRKRAESGKLTFLYSERLLKRGLWWRFFPLKVLRTYDRFTRYRKLDNVHVLCASAFTSNDLALSGFPVGRCWKWGYFTRIDGSRRARERVPRDGTVSILWAARLIGWKRPMWPLQFAKTLLGRGVDFEMGIVGEGPCRGEMEAYVERESLGDRVRLLGTVPNARVHELMSESDVFLFTSDRNEGWGAVLSEAMANGCAVASGSQIGSTPYLVEDGVNGVVFDGASYESFESAALGLVLDRERQARLGRVAAETMETLWNSGNAARSFIALSSDLLGGRASFITEGPCSPALPLADDWFAGA